MPWIAASFVCVSAFILAAATALKGFALLVDASASWSAGFFYPAHRSTRDAYDPNVGARLHLRFFSACLAF